MRLDPRRLLVHTVLRQIVRKDRFDTVDEFVAARQADPAPFAPPTGRAARGIDVTRTDVDGIAVFRLEPQQGGTSRTVVYLHGGSYIAEIGPPQWTFVLDLVRATGVTCVVPIYALAPVETAAQTVPRGAAAITAAIEEVGAAAVVVLGDSAGGGLALAAVEQLRDAAAALPARVVLLSPWVDAAVAHPDQPAIEPHDIMLRIDYLAAAGRVYAGDLAVDDPRVSPLHGDLSGLPPLHVFTGSHDILVTDSRELAGRVRAAGGEIEYVEAPDMQHDYAIFPILPESGAARRRIRQLLR